MKVTFLGTGVAIPEADRGPTSTLLRSEEASVLVDLGSGSLQKLQAAGCDLLDLDAVYLTHDHLDHLADLLPLLFSLHIPFYNRAEPLEIFASAETLERIRKLQSVFDDWLTPGVDEVRFRQVDRNDQFEYRDIVVETGAVVHTEASVGFRFTEKATATTVAIPGDTGKCDGVLELIRDANLAILECSVPDSYAMETHLCPSEIADLAVSAEPLAIALVHRYPLVRDLDIRSIIGRRFGGTILVPDDGHTVSVSTDGLEQLE
jgi:ribonuclease BN (tRNA processing enzyme)